jgi:hypothetical protein
MAVVELLVDQEELAVAKLFVDQEEWHVHGLQVTRSVFDLTVQVASVGISGHLKNFMLVPQYELINNLPKLFDSLRRDMVQ